jgi:hypothetical protein
MKKLNSILFKPYPLLGDIKRDLINNALIGLFVAFFLTLFQPFHIGEWETDFKVIKLFGFGLISFIVPTCINFIIQYYAKPKGIEEKWNLLFEIITIATVLLFIAFGNMLYGRFLGVMPFGFKAFIIVFGITCLVGLFPVTIHVILKHNKLLSAHLQQTIEINQQLTLQKKQPSDEGVSDKTNQNALSINAETEILLIAENEKDNLRLQTSQLLYIESADNYSTVVYLDQSGKRKKELIRSSLKRLEGQIKSENILRCHRTFIANLNNVKIVGGNAAGYKLYFDTSDETIPVSRNYIPVVGEKLKHLK